MSLNKINGILLITRTYSYAGDRITQIHQTNNRKKLEMQFRFYYNQNGNLTEKREYVKNQLF
ncbi:hypothetical protein [Dyadobacter crusticola]|uniref:hypothetical protein n=1 Tax=Dyadobacter crusticola TaxID=292407 RepID=UPI0004E129A7|nr:hypothetical protein [Dyadobacter crusticola]